MSADLPGIRDEITAALEDYRRVFPEPYSLSPNLQLAVRALAEVERQAAVIDKVAALADHDYEPADVRAALTAAFTPTEESTP